MLAVKVPVIAGMGLKAQLCSWTLFVILGSPLFLTVYQSEATIKEVLRKGNRPMRAHQYPLISFGELGPGALPPGAMPAKDSTQVLLEEADFAMNTIVAGEASWDGTALESRLRFDVIIDEPACANYVQTMLAQHYS